MGERVPRLPVEEMVRRVGVGFVRLEQALQRPVVHGRRGEPARGRGVRAEPVGQGQLLGHGVDLVGGQVLDLKAEKSKPTLSALQTIDRLKTGALIKAACTLGCLASKKYDEQKIAAASVYAENIGLAFQIVDDILDVTSDTATLGKPVGSDARNDKATYVTIFSLDEARRMAREAVGKAVQALEPLGPQAWFLKELVEHLLVRVH